MKDKMTLSEKMKKRKVIRDYTPTFANYLKEEDVKEFIKKLKENIPYKTTTWAKLMRLEINKLAGEELTK